MKVSFAQRGNYYDDEDKKALIDLMDQPATYNKWDIIKQFEREFAEYVGANYALAVTSGTSALQLCLKGIDVKPDDEIITTPITWVATANVIMLEHAKPVFVDVEPDSLNIDSTKIAEKITSRTAAIMPVHLAGHTADMDSIISIAEENGLAVISDAAHAPGAEYNSQKIGSIGDLTAYSFYTQKNISTLGEGGMISAADDEVMERIKLYQNHGVRYLSNYANPESLDKPWYRDCVAVGYNYRMSEGQAAVGITQLKKLDRFNEIRRRFAMLYSELLSDVKGITLPVEKEYAKSSWHFYIVKIEENFGLSRDEVIQKLRECGVQTNVHYTPLHYFAPYKALGYKLGEFPVAEAAYEKVLSLPLHVSLDHTQIEYVVDMLKRIRHK
jgi:perosamine synthetase